MKYNLSRMMTEAHMYRRLGMTMSAALREVWRLAKKNPARYAPVVKSAPTNTPEAKLEAVKSQLFLLEMKDRWNNDDSYQASILRDEINALTNQLAAA